MRHADIKTTMNTYGSALRRPSGEPIAG